MGKGKKEGKMLMEAHMYSRHLKSYALVRSIVNKLIEKSFLKPF